MGVSADYVEHRRLVGGFLTRYLEAGDPAAPTVLLLHDGAWGGAGDVTWSRCIPLFASRFHVIAPDFVGFGGSDKATYFDRASYDPRIAQLGALVDDLGITGPVHVVGSSFGGSVSLRILAADPPPFPVATATSIGGSGGRWKTALMGEQLGRWDGTREDLARVQEFLAERDDSFEAQLDLRYRWASEPGHYRAVASAAMPIPDRLRAAVDDPWPRQLSGVQTPTLIVAGTRDELFEPHWPEEVAAVLADATVARIDSLHSPNLDHPEELTALVVGFIDAHSAKRAQ